MQEQKHIAMCDIISQLHTGEVLGGFNWFPEIAQGLHAIT